MKSVNKDKIINVFGLLIVCPLNAPKDDCPAIIYQKLSLDEKYTLVTSMKEEELDSIIFHHKKCLKSREK